MMKPAIFLLLFLSFAGCKTHLTRAETEENLKSAMHNFLISRPNYDSSKAKYDVLKVNYYEDTYAYDCEFQVKLSVRGHDTTGIMTATISKDFAKVRRKL